MKRTMCGEAFPHLIRSGLGRICYTLFVLAANPILGIAVETTQPVQDHVPQPGSFPPAGAGVNLSGDLVVSDPMNRRGGLRKGDGTSEPRRHYFAMLPYGTVWYHGAPADIRDIPVGTHMHGRFLLPIHGEEETIPPLTEEQLKRNPTGKYNHAFLLEDDVSFYSRQGRSWQVLDTEQGGGPAPRLKLSVEPLGPEIKDGINKPILFDIDPSTRIWKNGRLVGIDQIKAGQQVQVNLTWGPFESLATTDIWLDDASLKSFKEIQRQRHLRLIRSRFLPGWVDAVKNNDTGGGEMTVTLFGGMDPLLYEEVLSSKHPRICDAETTLRTWGYHAEYAVHGETLEREEIENPPPGSSGIQLKLKVPQMLDGFRPGRVIRIKGPWTYVLLPHDEWLMTPDDFKRSSRMILP
ncbi:MAG: hypothetical protein P8N76_00080 [Pirellulaceae bacterium]|nr:hypothetical protein [Pirellulaceae bacterium]